MKKYIKAKDNENVPIILQGSAIKEIVLDGNEYSSLYSSTQFIISKIISPLGNYYHGYNSRLRKFWFGYGILWDTDYDRIVAIFLEEQKVAVLNNWIYSYPSEFTRFKKALKDAGYDVKKNKCISFVSNFDSFICDPLAPTFNDYSTEYQQSVSREFLLLERSAITIPVEEDGVPTNYADTPW